MIIGFLLILGCYVLAMAWVHAVHIRMRRRGKPTPIHVVLLTENNQHHIEWYLRYLHFVSWRKGRPVQVTIVDSGSTDETLAIVRRMKGKMGSDWIHVRFEDWSPAEGEGCIVISLRNQSELVPIPLAL